MRVNREMLNVQIEYINDMLVHTGVKNVLHIERFNGLTWVKNDIGETIAVGAPREVYNQLHVVRRILYSISINVK